MPVNPNRILPILLSTACMIVMAFQADSTSAQMINVRTPFQSNTGTFYERTGINFGFSFGGNRRIRGLSPTGQLLPRIQVTQGSAGVTAPTQGGYDPNASLRTGFATVGGDVNVAFGLEMGKGSRRSSSTQTPSVTMMNGQIGSIFSGAQRPFVTRIDPVIGRGGGNGLSIIRRPGYSNDGIEATETVSEPAPRTYSNPNSTAVHGDISIADIKKQRRLEEMVQDQEMLQELQELISKASTLASQGEYGAARAKFGRALRKVSDRPDLTDVKEHLQEKLAELKGKR